MTDPTTPIPAAQQAIGKERFGKFVAAQGAVDAEQMFLTLSVANCGMAGYHPAAIEAMRIDARDLSAAVNQLEEFVNQLADDWTAQREKMAADAARLSQRDLGSFLLTGWTVAAAAEQGGELIVDLVAADGATKTVTVELPSDQGEPPLRTAEKPDAEPPEGQA